MYRLLDHTGDFALEAEAETPELALAETARGLVALVLGDVTLVEREQRVVELEGFDVVDLLVAFGNELLFLFESERFFPARVVVDVLEPDFLRATLVGERLPQGHDVARPAKAVTHHDATFDVSSERTHVRLVIDL
ncbi:MAG: archease [Sandaracinus sp.]|nr:archease [Sandaracinus sp.]MCB9613007.1 archease [Sandaracinus sp.]MCB9622269.1 archease [Sandaracinus sp.]